MKKKFVRLISAVLSAAMTLTAVPLSAFAEGEAHTHDGESNVITTPLDFREKTADENGVGWSWDYDTKTLTLDGVNIQATTDSMSVVTVPDGTEIVLNGNNTIVQTNTDDSDTYVLSAVNTDTTNCDGTMTISGDGVLNAENRSTDSMARSLGGSIILNGGTVNATGTVKTNSLEIHNDGVLNANATTASFEGVAVNVSRGITVDGNGSLTAVGCANESTLNSAILLTSNFDKISVSENGSITVPEGNAARVGIYYSGNNGDGMDAEISGGKVTAYGAKYGIYKVNLIMSGTGSVYTTGGSYAIGQTVPTIDEDEFVVKGSTESKASESAVTGEVKLNGGYYEIDGADAKTVVIKPDTSPRIILGNQIGIFKTEEYKIIEDIDMTDIKLKGTVYFDITLKNMSDEEFADARGYFGGDEPDLLASIIKTDYGWVCMVCDTKFSTTYDTDNTLTIKCGDIVSNTVQVKSNANRFNKVTQGDNTNRTVFYTNTSQEEKDNYKLVSTYTVDSESISYNWYSTNSAYSADELGAAVSGSNGEFKLADNIPAGNYVLYCDITYSDGDSTETVTEKFTFTYKECAHENGYSDGKCTNCGALCDHSNIDIGTGKCNKCEHQFVATISTDGNAPTGYDTLADCLNSVTADTGDYVKIYQDIGDASATATLDIIDVNHNVMIDLNGHKLNNIKLGVNKLGVNKDVTLTLTGTAGSYVTQVYVRKGGGSFIIDSEANVEFNTIFVEDSARLAVNDGAKVTTEQLTVIASVNDDGTTTTSVKLATGMKLGGLTYHRQNNSGALKLGNLLDVTRQALQREDNGNYLDLYKEYGSMGYSVALTVVEHTDADHKYGSGTGKCEECGKPCEHGGDINTDTGICSICGAVVSVALYTDGDGNLQYIDTDELHSLLNEYNGSGTIKLFKDYDNSKAQYDLYGELTIDLNGRQFKIRSITPCKNGKLTIKNSGNPVMLGCNVYPTNDASYAGGTLIIDGDVVLDTSIYVYDSSTVILKAGAYPAGLYARDSKTLYDMLGEGKAFFKADGTLFNASVKEISSSETLTVKDHSHTYVDGKCGCGYQCAHDDVDTEAGVCRECNTKIYAAITVKSETGTTVKYFTKLTEAFEFAAKNENKGCTLKMLRAFSDSNTDINVDGGVLTVDMNGFGVNIHSFNGSGTKITIRSDSKCTFGVENGFSMDGGTVTFSGEVSVVCQNVKLNATYFSSYVEMLDIDTLILEDGVPLKQLARITNANIANINCSSEIYLYQILASGSCVDSQLYSDLKANASSNFDNVRIIRCDHPDGVGRDNRCIYCNSLIAASVSYTENGAEKTEYFVKEDLGKAFAKANSVASATITMLMSSAYDTDYLNVTGDVTLIANGDNAILYNTVKVADGGKLTLRGNANIFAAIAEPGSRLTAEEATRIAYLTVNGGDVKLSGGQYDNITVKDGKITDILGNGYAYKKTEGGAWLTLKEREVSEASGVTVAKAPIKSATLSTEINKLYRNSNANPTLKFNLALAHGSNLNDSYVSKRYGINSYVSGDIIYSSLSALVKDAKLSADEIIDKAGDSDVAEIYFVVITDDGYEIKSNTVSIDLVDCDHSQVVDPTADKETAGNITTPTYCEICKSKFNAKITKGDDVRYYNDLDEAAKDAQKSENEGCTLYPLYNKNGYGGQLVITEGNFTLKYAVRTAFSRPIIINGKAKLTVTGRCAVTAFENQDAFIVRGGDVTFDGLATGSNVTINGGNVTMAANNINCLTIHGGNVSISSGGFAEIVTTVSDKVIADYIDHGFWVQDRETKEWIDIYSLNKATASSTNGLTVRLCPMQIIKPIDTVYYTNGYYPDGIPSLQINAEPWYSNEVDAKVAYQWFAIDENGYETVIEGATDRKLSLENLTTGRYYCRLTYSNATTAGVSMKSDVVTATITECEHSGGEATCTKKAKCEICGAEYGEPLGHEYIETVVAPTYTSEGYTVFECTRCKHKYNGNFVPVKPIPDVEEIAVEKTTYNEVDISWKNISGVDGYYVECYVGNQWKQIGFSTDGDRVAAKLSGLSAGLKYKVRIAAYAGSFTGKFRCFYVDTIPSPVWNINTVKATDETVRISWNRNTRADGYKVEWYIDNQWSAKTVTGNNNIAAVIDGLCAGTRYKVRVSAYKGDLYSPYTYGYIDTLPSKVTGITQTVTSSSFTLTWDKNESADGYTVQYYADGKWNEKTLTGNGKTTVTIGSLKGYKTYKVRIKAYKGELQSTFDDIYITTAPTKVSGLKVKSAVDSKAVVIWNADTNADGYNVGYYIGGKWVEKTITDNKTAMAELDGLTPYSTYKVRVRAYKGKLYGDYSYTTVTAVLSPVTDIKVVSAKRNSITVKWGKNASADGYKVEIYKGGKWVKKTLKGSANATVTIGGLRAGSVYKVRIASYKGANTSTYTYANVNTAK